MASRSKLLFTVIVLAVALSGCRSDSAEGGAPALNPPPGGGIIDPPDDDPQVTTPEAFFSQRLQGDKALDSCRMCHIPNGVADTPAGERFLLSHNAADDYGRVYDAWLALGAGVADNHLLKMPSDASLSHSGGLMWPVGSQRYQDMTVLLSCWNDPENCLSYLGVAPPPVDIEELPLLGSTHARHLWDDFCEDDGNGNPRPNNALLPPDPRSLVRPGINEGGAVFFNAYWEDCHTDPDLKQQVQTCGEYRDRIAAGLKFMLDELPSGNTSASAHNNTWQNWGLNSRPENFDDLYTLRYGLNEAPFHNPYPLPGEDPNATNGGSGRLPQGLRQRQNANGSWTGQIGSAICFDCHGGQVGEPNVLGIEHLGLGNSNYDVLMAARDGVPLPGVIASSLPPITIEALFNIGIKQRGQNNAVGAFEFLVTLLDLDTLGVNPNPLKTMVSETGAQDMAHPLAHTQDTPPWWNFGSRSRKFFDAGVSTDSTRIIMAAGAVSPATLFTTDGAPYRNRIEEYDRDIEAFLISLESPPYPGEIDTALAEQGAILFHSKDLWAHAGNADRPEPLGGNGSCAGCHGVYSERYANDPNYLENPLLRGIAGHISPLAVIGTDRARSDMLTPTLRERWGTTYWGYAPLKPGKLPLEEQLDDMYPTALRPDGTCHWEQDVIGYQAPPLHGVWATAPYFHNGSVPTLEQVLDSSKRPQIWRRMLRSDPTGQVVGFDQSLERAFDHQRVGWKHDVLTCQEIPGTEQINCNPVEDKGPSLQQLVTNFLNSALSWSGLLTIHDPNPEGFDKRLIFDSRILGNDNGGHDFSDVLSDAERRAIIEYLKTL